MHANGFIFQTAISEHAWSTVFPLSTLEFPPTEHWEAMAACGFCCRMGEEHIWSPCGKIWTELPEGVIFDDLVVPSFRSSSPPMTRAGLLERLGRRFKRSTPPHFFKEIMPAPDGSGVGLVYVRIRWNMWKSIDIAHQVRVQELGAEFTIFPNAGRWPGPPLAAAWASRKVALKLWRACRPSEGSLTARAASRARLLPLNSSSMSSSLPLDAHLAAKQESETNSSTRVSSEVSPSSVTSGSARSPNVFVMQEGTGLASRKNSRPRLGQVTYLIRFFER